MGKRVPGELRARVRRRSPTVRRPSPIGWHQPWGSESGSMGERVPGVLRARVRRRSPIVRHPFPIGSHQPCGGGGKEEMWRSFEILDKLPGRSSEPKGGGDILESYQKIQGWLNVGLS